MAEEPEVTPAVHQPVKASKCAQFLYYIVLFFAYWFGSHRFDMDGDGDFDPEDVQAYLADKGFLVKNFKQSRTSKKRIMKHSKTKYELDTQPEEGSLFVIQVEGGLSPRSASKKQGEEETEASAAVLAEAMAAVAEGNEEAEGAEAKAEVDKKKKVKYSRWDWNKDGKVDVDDVIVSKVEGPNCQEDQMLENLIDRQMAPWFMIFQCTTVLMLWVVLTIKDMGKHPETSPFQLKSGVESIWPGLTELVWFSIDCDDYTQHCWRWFSYQFTHVGAVHVLMNIFLCIMLGVPLEGIHGKFRMAIMFNVGVIGGALFYYVNDAHKSVVGCSGGCYSLIGIHLADLIMNWRQKKFRIPTFLFIILLVGVDILSYMTSMSPENASHSAHIGGAFAGLIIGVLLCKNISKKKWEYVLMVLFALVGLGAAAFCLYWIFTTKGGPMNYWEASAGEKGYCWVRQVYLRTVSEYDWLCIRCGNKPCMEFYTKNMTHIRTVSWAVCSGKKPYIDER